MPLKTRRKALQKTEVYVFHLMAHLGKDTVCSCDRIDLSHQARNIRYNHKRNLRCSFCSGHSLLVSGWYIRHGQHEKDLFLIQNMQVHQQHKAHSYDYSCCYEAKRL